MGGRGGGRGHDPGHGSRPATPPSSPCTRTSRARSPAQSQRAPLPIPVQVATSAGTHVAGQASGTQTLGDRRRVRAAGRGQALGIGVGAAVDRRGPPRRDGKVHQAACAIVQTPRRQPWLQHAILHEDQICAPEREGKGSAGPMDPEQSWPAESGIETVSSGAMSRPTQWHASPCSSLSPPLPPKDTRVTLSPLERDTLQHAFQIVVARADDDGRRRIHRQGLPPAQQYLAGRGTGARSVRNGPLPASLPAQHAVNPPGPALCCRPPARVPSHGSRDPHPSAPPRRQTWDSSHSPPVQSTAQPYVGARPHCRQRRSNAPRADDRPWLRSAGGWVAWRAARATPSRRVVHGAPTATRRTTAVQAPPPRRPPTPCTHPPTPHRNIHRRGVAGRRGLLRWHVHT